MNVTVKASERVQLISVDPIRERANSQSSALLEQPRGCLSSMESCALRVGARRKLELEAGAGRKWILTENTIVIRLSSGRLRFVEGSLKVSGDTTVVETEQGELTVRGEAFIDRRASQMTVVNTGNQALMFRGRGWATPQEIPVGLEARIDLPSVENGLTAIDLPLPFDFEKQVVREARVFGGDKAEFPKRLEYLARLRADAAIESAAFHKEVVDRKIASVARQQATQREAREKREVRDRELRALFRRKVLNPE